MQTPVGVHAVLWNRHNVERNCAKLIDPRAEAEVKKQHAGRSSDHVARNFELCRFNRVIRRLFISGETTPTEFHVSVGAADLEISEMTWV